MYLCRGQPLRTCGQEQGVPPPKSGPIPFDIIHTPTRHSCSADSPRNDPLPEDSDGRDIPHPLQRTNFYGATHSKTMTEHLVRMILKHFETADEVWTPTEWSKRKLYEYGFKGEVIVMPNGCDMVLPSEQQHAAYRSAGRAALKLDKDIPVCLYVGQLKKEKNIGLTIEALGLARAKKFDFHMVFVGTGSDRPYFERMLEERNLAKSSTFTVRISDWEQFKTIFAASDLFLFPRSTTPRRLSCRRPPRSACRGEYRGVRDRVHDERRCQRLRHRQQIRGVRRTPDGIDGRHGHGEEGGSRGTQNHLPALEHSHRRGGRALPQDARAQHVSMTGQPPAS